jgi:hypothetical protein
MSILESLKTSLWEWGHEIPGEKYMQISVPINGRITEEAKAKYKAFLKAVKCGQSFEEINRTFNFSSSVDDETRGK